LSILVAESCEFIGITGEYSVKTELLPMLLNMHDYNHQNGTHRPLFEIEEVLFDQFIDEGHHSHAYYYRMPRSQPSIKDILANLALLAMPKVVEAHLENFFPMIVLFHGTTFFGKIKQCHIFVPESESLTRTHVLVYGQPSGAVGSLLSKMLRSSILRLVDTVIKQDADILHKLYPGTPQKIKLNNEVGMDWVHRNFENFPKVTEPNFSR
jgi:hypothetical protein